MPDGGSLRTRLQSALREGGRLARRPLSGQPLLVLEQHFDWRITGRWMLLSVAVGVVGGLSALVFSWILSQVTRLALTGVVGYTPPLPGGEGGAEVAFDLAAALHPAHRWWLLVVPAAGGLLSGWLVYRFAPDAEGHGTDGVIRAFHRQKGLIRWRVPLVKIVASALTIGTGGSAGREGPITQVGAAFGSLLAQRFRLSVRERRLLLVAGMAAGIGAVFRSPLGGAFFAVEVLYREDLESEALMPAAVAGITGYSVYAYLEDSASIFNVGRFQFVSPLELLPLVPFALVCALVGALFVRVFYGMEDRVFKPLPIPKWMKPGVGGLLLGALALLFPPILGSSYGWLQQAMDGALPLKVMALLAVLKILSTSLTVGSGGSGGVFAPSLVIGGMLGGLFGEGLHEVAPSLVTQPGAYVMIGMATFFAGVANTPIATTVMISELTGSYTLLVPLLFTGVTVQLASRRWSLYREQVRTSNESPAHRLDLTPDLLAETPVSAVVVVGTAPPVFQPGTPLPAMLDAFAGAAATVIPVAAPPAAGDPPGLAPAYTGLVLLDTLQGLLTSDEEIGALVVAADVTVPFRAVRLTETLDVALGAFLDTQYPELPVLGADGRVVGLVRQAEVVGAYYRAYLRRRQEEGEG